MTQEKIILKLLEENDWVSTVDAVDRYILRLGAIIFSLKKKGYKIDARKVEGKSYEEYHLVSKPVSWDNLDKEWSKSGKQAPQTPNSLNISANEMANVSGAGAEKPSNVPTSGQEATPLPDMTPKTASLFAILATTGTPKAGNMKNRANTENL